MKQYTHSNAVTLMTDCCTTVCHGDLQYGAVTELAGFLEYLQGQLARGRHYNNLKYILTVGI